MAIVRTYLGVFRMPPRWFFTSLLIATAGCGTSKEENPLKAVDLNVAAASDLQAVLPELSDRFTAVTGIRVTPVIGASGQLAQQIRQGAPFDVFLSANMAFVRDLAKDG